jgi:hypothetical protein
VRCSDDLNMKTLGNVIPTPEQALVIDDDEPGFWLVGGAAGSGKTTTALLRLKSLVRYWRDRCDDANSTVGSSTRGAKSSVGQSFLSKSIYARSPRPCHVERRNDCRTPHCLQQLGRNPGRRPQSVASSLRVSLAAVRQNVVVAALTDDGQHRSASHRRPTRRIPSSPLCSMGGVGWER